MFNLMILFLLMVVLFTFMMISNPLVLIFVMFFYLVLMVILLCYILSSYFYSFILFLLFISGLMILFMYICSIILNEKFIVNLKNFTYFNFFWISLTLCTYFNYSGSLLYEGGLIYYNELLVLLKFYVFSYSWLSIFFVFYLLICLIIIFNILKSEGGVLRTKG